jgi:hypothetical protein
MFRSYRRGFSWGLGLGALWLLWVYRRAEQFPGDPALNRYYAWLRHLPGAPPINPHQSNNG